MVKAAPDAGNSDGSVRAARPDPLWVNDEELVLPTLDPHELTRIMRKGKVKSGRLTLGPDGVVPGIHPDDVETLARWGAIYAVQRRDSIPAHKERMRRLRKVKAETTALGEEFSAPELRWDEGVNADNLLDRQLLLALLEEFQDVWHRHGGQGQGLSNDKEGRFGGPIVELAEYVIRRTGQLVPSRSSMKDAWQKRSSSAGKPPVVRKARYAGST